MVYINEWFPNPTGNDAKGEFIELYNGGSGPVGLKGWVIETEGHKKFTFNGGAIPANGYLVLNKAQSKLSLRNNDGALALYNANGHLVDLGSFTGTAPEGESFSRIERTSADTQQFAFVTPTPGGANQTIDNAITVRNYPLGVSLVPHVTGGELLVMMLGTGAMLAGLILYIIRSHEDLSHILFKGDEGTWPGAGPKDSDDV